MEQKFILLAIISLLVSCASQPPTSKFYTTDGNEGLVYIFLSPGSDKTEAKIYTNDDQFKAITEHFEKKGFKLDPNFGAVYISQILSDRGNYAVYKFPIGKKMFLFDITYSWSDSVKRYTQSTLKSILIDITAEPIYLQINGTKIYKGTATTIFEDRREQLTASECIMKRKKYAQWGIFGSIEQIGFIKE